jgi:CheY-like chemotaxis protein
MSTVLIVDDHRDTGRLLTRFLRANGREAVAVDNGLAALAFVGASRPSLVLLDVMMPEMDGFETLSRLRQLPGAADLPVVMFTALGDEESRQRAAELGAIDYLVKGSFDPRRLMELLAEHAPPM